MEVELPAVVSIARAADEPSGRADGRIDVWTASDLVDDVSENDKRFGQTGIADPRTRRAGRDARAAGLHVASSEEAADVVQRLLEELKPTLPSWEKPGHIAEQPGASYDAWSIVEVRAGRPTRTSLELVGKARELAGKLGGRSAALLVGHELDRGGETRRSDTAPRRPTSSTTSRLPTTTPRPSPAHCVRSSSASGRTCS